MIRDRGTAPTLFLLDRGPCSWPRPFTSMGNLGPSAALAGYVLFLFKRARHSWIDPLLYFAQLAIAVRV